MKKCLNIFFALKSCSASQHCIFHKVSSQSFTIRFVPTIFPRFSHICHGFFHCFSRAFFRTSDFAHFSYHVFQRCAVKRFFIVCSLCTAYNCCSVKTWSKIWGFFASKLGPRLRQNLVQDFFACFPPVL